MASLQGKYDENAALPSDREPLPADTYTLEFIESDVVANNKGTGDLMKYKTQVTEGDFAKRQIWGQINLTHDTATTQEIGQKEMAAVRAVTGVDHPTDSEDFHYKAFPAVVGLKPASRGKDGKDYGPKNEINWGATVKLMNGGATPPAANDNKPVNASAPKAANDNKPPVKAERPWGKK